MSDVNDMSHLTFNLQKKDMIIDGNESRNNFSNLKVARECQMLQGVHSRAGRILKAQDQIIIKKEGTGNW